MQRNLQGLAEVKFLLGQIGLCGNKNKMEARINRAIKFRWSTDH